MRLKTEKTIKKKKATTQKKKEEDERQSLKGQARFFFFFSLINKQIEHTQDLIVFFTLHSTINVIGNHVHVLSFDSIS
jgi:hypothetical protein